MRIVSARRISQSFFFALFLWFCIVASLGERYWQLRGWPVNWILQLDPLVALGTLLTTGTLYSGLAWALLTIGLTAVLGRFCCAWVCPFGAMHHFIGWLGQQGRSLKQKLQLDAYRPAQAVKYYLLFFLLTAAAGDLAYRLRLWSLSKAGMAGGLLLLAALLALAWVVAGQLWSEHGNRLRGAMGLALLGLILGWWSSPGEVVAASLQTGLLDPIPLVHRSVNLILLPALDAAVGGLSVSQRYCEGSWLILAVFVAALLLNLLVPRFYCRFVCPLGALMGILGRWAVWRVGKKAATCRNCVRCQAHCEGACDPAGAIHQSECVLCMNCLDRCADGEITFAPARSAAGEITGPDLTRRGVVASIASGALLIPSARLGGLVGPGWQPGLIRPPGALEESQFLERCLKCGQCMRVCPTNVLQPAGLDKGLEALWTPALNMRMGTSGCQLNCVACGQLCPSAAIRPITPEEKRGLGPYAAKGPIRLGTAFVDQGRCLPWAMDKPCIVCQENCPVSPKAIFTREHYGVVISGLKLEAVEGKRLKVSGEMLAPGRMGAGDYYAQGLGPIPRRLRLAANGADWLALETSEGSWSPGMGLEISVRLQRPVVDPARCIGCGVCEHECPVSGLRAIRIGAENESRSPKRLLLL